jgi:hypothetical protein
MDPKQGEASCRAIRHGSRQADGQGRAPSAWNNAAVSASRCA